MPAVPEIIAAMRSAAPPGLSAPDPAALAELRRLTAELAVAMPASIRESERYLAIGRRRIIGVDAEIGGWLEGLAVLVTGGTGCIGSTLIGELAALGAGRVVSVSRGVSEGWPRHDGVEYARADVRDPAAIEAVFGYVKPDVVFHLAGQRDPGLAETEVHRTVTTNVLGTWQVAAAAAEHSVRRLICASTGKALRPFSNDVYTGSKRTAEWVLARVAGGGLGVAAARFTHVVDNSIVAARLRRWCADGVIRLHSADALFYAQSAIESAQLLMSAGPRRDSGAVLIHALTDLGWPVSLLELAVGSVLQAGSRPAIYFSGPDAGYEVRSFPGLYDPQTASEVSPLFNAFEAARSSQLAGLGVDTFPLTLAPDDAPGVALDDLRLVCAETTESAPIRRALSELSWSVLHASLGAAPTRVLARMAAQAAPHRGELGPEHARLLDAIEQHAGLSSEQAGRHGRANRDRLGPAEPRDRLAPAEPRDRLEPAEPEVTCDRRRATAPRTLAGGRSARPG